MESRTWWWVGGGAVVLAIILFFVFSGGDDTTTPVAAETTTTEATTAVKTCFVTDDAGVDDRSFNASGWQGVNDAVASGAVQPDPILLESDSEADYQPHVETCLAQGAEHIVTSGFKLAATTETFAAANPDVQWTIIDFASVGANVTGLEYQTDEGAFAAGYLSAGMTKTGFVGTYGGVDIPTVTIFMDGFARGVAHYNDVKGTSVVVLGYPELGNPAAALMTGTFDPADPLVLATCQGLLDEGADIILPVGGTINVPCGEAILGQGIDGALIGVDADAFDAMPEGLQEVWLVTILKGIAIQTQRSLEADASGAPTGGSSSVGNLENGSIGLSEFHAWDDRVSDELAAETAQVLEDIKNGAIDWDKYVVGTG